MIFRTCKSPDLKTYSHMDGRSISGHPYERKLLKKAVGKHLITRMLQ